MKLKVGAYCRVSTDKDQTNSFNSQKKYFTEFINRNPDWELVQIYADEGLSGTDTKKRIAFLQMIEDAKNKKLELILTKEISRFARNTLDSIEYTRMLKKWGIGVIFINDNINTLEGDGELRLTIMAGIAQDESRRTSERVKWGQKRRMEQGVVFGRELLGYNLHKGILTINKEESDTVKLIFHKYLIEGKGTHVIAKELLAEKIKPKGNSDKWSNTMILKVLRNEKYVGDLLQKKTLTPDYLDHKKINNKGQENMVYIRDHHEPIIDRKTWDATQLELIRRTASADNKSKYSNRYWCSGLILCGFCGKSFISKSKKLKSSQIYKSWRCITSGCNNNGINHLVLCKVMAYLINKIISNKDQIISQILNSIKCNIIQKSPINKESLIRKIDSIKAKKQKLINLMLDEAISKDDMILMNRKYDNDIDMINNDIRKLEASSIKSVCIAASDQIYANRVHEILSFSENQNMDFVYKSMISKIYVYKDILKIYFNSITDPIIIKYSCSGKNGNYKIKYILLDCIPYQ